MSLLAKCPTCDGYVNSATGWCVNCGSPEPTSQAGSEDDGPACAECGFPIHPDTAHWGYDGDPNQCLCSTCWQELRAEYESEQDAGEGVAYEEWGRGRFYNFWPEYWEDFAKGIQPRPIDDSLAG